MKEFIDGLTDADAAEVAAAMAEVREEGLRAARHIRGEIYEVRAEVQSITIRILFAPEGTKGRILLTLEGFEKKTQRTPERFVHLAERRLADWRRRVRARGRSAR